MYPRSGFNSRRRPTNAIGLDNTIPFVHEMEESRELVFDLMELWRTNSDFSILQALEQLKRSEKTHYLTDGYEVVPESGTVHVVVERLKTSLSLYEILSNARLFARSLLGEEVPAFAQKPVRVGFERDNVK